MSLSKKALSGLLQKRVLSLSEKSTTQLQGKNPKISSRGIAEFFKIEKNICCNDFKKRREASRRVCQFSR